MNKSKSIVYHLGMGKKAGTLCSGCVTERGLPQWPTREIAGQLLILFLPWKAQLSKASFLLLSLLKAGCTLASSCLLPSTELRAEWTHSNQRNSSVCSCISFMQLLLSLNQQLHCTQAVCTGTGCQMPCRNQRWLPGRPGGGGLIFRGGK